MAISSNSLFNTNVEKTAKVFKALGHPVRLLIVKHLMENESCFANQLVNLMPYSQPTVSRHLAELTNAGITKAEKKGSHLYFEINPVGLSAVKDLLDKLLTYTQWNK